MTIEQRNEIMNDFQSFKNPQVYDFHWQDGGKFRTEILAEMEEENRKEARLHLRQECAIQQTRHQLNLARKHQALHGINVVIGDLVAVKQTDQPQRFWIDKVIEILAEQLKLKVHWYSAPSEFRVYKIWTGKDKTSVVPVRDIVSCFTKFNDGVVIILNGACSPTQMVRFFLKFFKDESDDSDESNQYSSEKDDEEDSDTIPESSLRQRVERKHRISDATSSSSSSIKSQSSKKSRLVFILSLVHGEVHN